MRTALISEGTGRSPETGDPVFFHYIVRQESSRQVVASTLTEHGGAGCPHVAVLEKGTRIPRAWELVLKGGAHVACANAFKYQLARPLS